MKRFLFSLLLIPSLLSAQKIDFSIEIHFQLATPVKRVLIFRNLEYSVDTFAYPDNNILKYSGTINNPGTFQIVLDSLAATTFWVDDIPVSITCSEEKTKQGNTKLIIKDLIGSEDSKLYSQLFQQRKADTTRHFKALNKEQIDSVFGFRNSKVTSISIDSINVLIKKQIDSAFRDKNSGFVFEMKQRDSALKIGYYNLIDSIFKVRPESPVIPYYISFYERVLESKAVSEFYKRLSVEGQKSDEGQRIKRFLDRSSLIQKGSFIENFTMKNEKGKKFSLYDVSSKYILLDFWASWCGPCRVENPELLKVYNEYKERGLTIIGISLDENKQKWTDAINKDNLPWLHVSELKGWDNSLYEKYKISSIPFTILLDSNYKVVAHSLRSNELETFLSGQ